MAALIILGCPEYSWRLLSRVESLQYCLRPTHTAPDVDEDQADKHHLAHHRQAGVITVTAENNHADQKETPALYLEFMNLYLPFEQVMIYH